VPISACPPGAARPVLTRRAPPRRRGRLPLLALAARAQARAAPALPSRADARSSQVSEDAAAPQQAAPNAASAPDWANGGRWSFGLQGAFGFQNPVPPRGEHIKLLYAQPQAELNLVRFNRGPVGRFDWLSEGLLGGAVSPAARIIGYSLLFRLEGRTRGNTKPILDFGAGINNTTLDQHVYELTGGLQFTPQGGLGIEHYFGPQRAVVFEYRFLHMSNNGIREPNHGFNAAVFSVGIRWLRRPKGANWR